MSVLSRRSLAPGDRVMVVNRLSSFMGEAGSVVRTLERKCEVRLDGEDETDIFFYDELEVLP